MGYRGGEAEYLITANGTIYPLDALGVKVTGLGNIPVEYQKMRGYGQHGETVLSWRLGARQIGFTLDRGNLAGLAYWQARQRLIDILSPQSGMVTYRRVLPNGRRRDIAGWLQAGMSLNEYEDRSGFTAEFTLECPSPSFYDPVLQSVVLGAGHPDYLGFPFSFGDDRFWFDSPGIARGKITYEGTWRSYPAISITGPYGSITVRNVTTGARFTLGVPVASGEVITVDLTPGEQSITDSAGDNLLSHRSAGTFIDWYLVPGTNDIFASGTGNSSQTSVQVSYHTEYISL